jgi:hypothetical protein
MKLSATWEGDLPAIGDYLKSDRGTFAYRICGVHVITEGTIDRGEIVSMTKRATFMVERIHARDLPARARVHRWKWANRSPKEKPCRDRK